ncbi:hypothetical protein Xen7305DRAFT_00048620 [Xenococcus sp. PCC 7305]|uniref:telomere resolvase n=1 Tax=Xenococcus sp. PCC 7305 TaxID=102125 RepID=UPI0002AC2D63|nr:telomere resolvase [Xenococcus sp. PCC 7305]ELS05122.1 hypothetical protein Xen7305DRAFT_00048620 [Xenococcus sp. PCC 7305]
MAIARLAEFLTKLQPLTDEQEIKILCNHELDYLRRELNIKTLFSEAGYPKAVEGDARRLKVQVSKYRKEIKTLATNEKNSYSKIKNGEKIYFHKALKYFNLEDYEKQDVTKRDRSRVTKDKTHRPSFNAVKVIETSLSLLDSESYISKTLGLYLLTGRRHSEILITGNFEDANFNNCQNELTNQWLENTIESALFTGQVKRKSQDDIGYNIPLLAPLDTIYEVIAWLREYKPHQPGQRPKGSKELGLKCRKVFEETQLLPLPSGKNNYLNPHNLRSAYSAICWQLYRHSKYGFRCTEDLFIKEIMGHTEDSTESAQSYLDYEISDVHLEQLLNYYA